MPSASPWGSAPTPTAGAPDTPKLYAAASSFLICVQKAYSEVEALSFLGPF